MIQASTLQFLKALKKNNNREWFEKNRPKYENAKQDYLQFVTEVLDGIKKSDQSLQFLEPKQCVFRIHRDARFSKNKDPYKTNFGASFSLGAKKIDTAGYYFHLEPGACFIGGGFWFPMAPELNKIRQEMDYCFKEFKSIINEKKFKNKYGVLNETDKLVRPPKGYEPNNPAIEYLKLKNLTATMEITDADVLNKNLVKKVISSFEALSPLVHFLNKAIV
jgi:uncharacterized protein (TIGR02453 family)